MSGTQVICPLCQKDVESKAEDKVKIGEKGAEGFNNASVERRDSINVIPGAVVHKYCCMNYINKKIH